MDTTPPAAAAPTSAPPRYVPSSTDGTRREGFSDQERDSIQHLLKHKLGKELTATRPGAGGSKFTYVEGWQVIEIANHIFGFNGWSSTVIDISPDYLSEENGKFEVGVTAVVKVTLKDGTCHEDVGYGMAEGPKKGPAIEKAKKQAVTDARKRALRLFGAALGNCLYSKQHVKKIRSARPDEEGFLEADIGEVKAKTVVRAAPYPGASSINGGGGGGGGGPCAATSTSSSSSSLSSNGVSPPRPLAPGIKEERPYMPAPTTTTSTTSPTSGMRPGAYQPQPQPQQARPQQPQQQQHFQPMPPRPPMQQQPQPQPQPQPQYSSPNAPMFAAIPVQTTSHSQTLPPLEDYDAAIPDECGDDIFLEAEQMDHGSAPRGYTPPQQQAAYPPYQNTVSPPNPPQYR